MTVVDPRIAKKAQALAIIQDEPWSTTEEVAVEMKHSARLVRSLLLDLMNDGKIIYQEKKLPRRKVAVMWRAKEDTQ
jgi:hypothetical protein